MIQEALTSASMSRFVCRLELDCNSEEFRKGVSTFVDHELQRFAAQDEGTALFQQWNDNIERLVISSAGLFIYASTAVKIIEASTFKFETLQSLTSGEIRLDGVDDLYTVALENSGIQWKSDVERTQFQDIIHFLVSCKAPVSDNVIDGLLDIPLQHSSRFILEKLRPLVAYERDQPISFHHITIRDYFVNAARLGKMWSLDVSSRQDALAHRCFAAMEKLLRFNICGLQSSFLSNDEIDCLPARVKDNIPPHLHYASLYWAQHLPDCGSVPALLDAVSAFLYKQLLHWAEVLSLLKQSPAADKIILDAARWASQVKASFVRTVEHFH